VPTGSGPGDRNILWILTGLNPQNFHRGRDRGQDRRDDKSQRLLPKVVAVAGLLTASLAACPAGAVSTALSPGNP